VAKSKAEIDVGFNLDDVRHSLRFIADHGAQVSGAVATATGKIFARTRDDETRRACLESLSRISNPKARNELLRISQNTDLERGWRDIAEVYLERMNDRAQPISASTATKTGQPD
jgi:hypothetical protein